MKKYLFITVILFTMFRLVSEEVDVTILSQKQILSLIEDSIVARDENVFSYLDSLDTESQSYNKYETYILEKALELTQGGYFEYSLKLVEAVLYNNLENSDAQDLYAVLIDKNIERDERQQAEELKEEQKREEIILQTEEIDKIYAEEERMAGIVTSNQELLTTINGYVDSFDKLHYVSTSFVYPLLTRFYSSEIYDGFHNSESTINSYDGFATEVGIGINYKSFVYRMDIAGNISYNELLKDNIKQITGAINMSLGYKFFNVPLCLRVGFLYDTYMYDDMANTEVAITTLPSPSLGLGITGLKLFKVLKVDLSSDLLLTFPFVDNLDLALSNRAYLTLNLFRINIYNFEIRAGLDNLYYLSGGLEEYSLTPRFGFGINSYE